MTNDIKGVLITVEPSDPHGLLKTGPFGARPPALMFGRWGSFDDDTAWWTTMDWALWAATLWPMGRCREPSEGLQFGLVLAWDGKPVREGCYRVADANGTAPSAVPGAIECVLDGDQMLRSIAKLGTIVLIDAEGREVKDA